MATRWMWMTYGYALCSSTPPNGDTADSMRRRSSFPLSALIRMPSLMRMITRRKAATGGSLPSSTATARVQTRPSWTMGMGSGHIVTSVNSRMSRGPWAADRGRDGLPNREGRGFMELDGALHILLHSHEPSVRWKARVLTLGEDRSSPGVRGLEREIRR